MQGARGVSLRVVVGVGANLGDRLATMRAAVARIDAIDGVRVLARSRLYETVPVGVVEQPAFMNGAVLVECTLSPLALLDALLAIERELGRTRSQDTMRWGPRTIDLDVLWIDGVALDDPHLVVPHPRMHERAFALVPLLDVAPGATDPTTGEAYAVMDDGGVCVTSATW
jgi:2-amino-4-hydroxy-6-hydroxymethyldihydropteridine diphosphokinase